MSLTCFAMHLLNFRSSWWLVSSVCLTCDSHWFSITITRLTGFYLMVLARRSAAAATPPLQLQLTEMVLTARIQTSERAVPGNIPQMLWHSMLELRCSTNPSIQPPDTLHHQVLLPQWPHLRPHPMHRHPTPQDAQQGSWPTGADCNQLGRTRKDSIGTDCNQLGRTTVAFGVPCHTTTTNGTDHAAMTL